MYYRIADVAVESELALPSFEAFACPPAAADVTLTCTKERPPEGKELVSGDLVHRILPDGWFCHGIDGEGCGLFISGDYSRLRFTGADEPDSLWQAERFVRVALECLLIRRGFLSLHAAAVETDGAAYAFCGPSGIGKSTRAEAWKQAFGARLLSGDRPLIHPDGQEAFGVPWDGKERCFRNARLLLAAICEVRRAETVRVRELSFAQRLRLLTQQCFLPMWDTDTAAIQMRNIFRLASGATIVRAFGGASREDAEALRAMIDRKEFLKAGPDMKAKPGFVLRNIVGEHLLMPTGDNISVFKGSVLLNEVSAFVWEKLQLPVSREDLLQAVLAEFDVDEATASADLDKLLAELNGYGLLEDMP